MKKNVLHEKALSLWKKMRSWFLFVTLLLVLRYTGVLAGISVYSSSALMEMGLLEADPVPLPKNIGLNFNFTIKDLTGETIDFKTFKGKTLFINIWATWCGPCRAEMPSIQKLYDKIDKEKIVFVMLSIDSEGDLRKIKKYVQSNEYTFPTYLAGELPDPLNVTMIPSTFVVTPAGEIVYQKSGMSNYDSDKFYKFLNETSLPKAAN